MGYKSITERINRFYESEFTMDSFQELIAISKEIEKIYYRKVKKKSENALIRFNVLRAQLNEMVFYKLKESLHFEDETINKIMLFMNHAKDIEDIYVFDGNVIVKFEHSDDNSSVYFLPTSDFMDVTSIVFNDKANVNMKVSLVNLINKTLFPLVGNNILSISSDASILYTTPGVNVFLNKRISDITNISENNLCTIAKLIVRLDDKFLYYDVKIKNGSIVLSENDYKVHVVSEILDKKNKVKIKK